MTDSDSESETLAEIQSKMRKSAKRKDALPRLSGRDFLDAEERAAIADKWKGISCAERPEKYWATYKIKKNRYGEPLEKPRTRCLKKKCYRGLVPTTRDRSGHCKKSKPKSKKSKTPK